MSKKKPQFNKRVVEDHIRMLRTGGGPVMFGEYILGHVGLTLVDAALQLWLRAHRYDEDGNEIDPLKYKQMRMPGT